MRLGDAQGSVRGKKDPVVPGTSDPLLERTDLIYGSEIGTWLTDGGAAVNPDTPVPQLIKDAGITAVRFAVYDAFTDALDPTGEPGKIKRSDFDHAIDGIINTLGCVPIIKLLPITRDTIDGKAGDIFVPPLDNLGMVLPWHKMIVQQAGPRVRIYESSNELEYAAWRKWGFTSAGAVGVSTAIGHEYAANMPALRKYAREQLGFEILTAGYVGISGGFQWGSSVTIESPRVRACQEFNDALYADYLAAGKDPDYIPDAISYHVYPLGSDFLGTTSIDDVIAYYDSLTTAWRNILLSVWGDSIGGRIKMAVSEWNAGTWNSDVEWPGFLDGRVDTFYARFLQLLKDRGYWFANQFALASNPTQMYDMVNEDGTVRSQYYAFKNFSKKQGGPRFEIFDYAQTPDGAFAPGHEVTIYESDGTTKATLYDSETGGTTSNPIVSDSTGLVHCWVTSTELDKSVDGGPLTPLKIVAPVGGGLQKSVTDYGAAFDGVHDDTAAINDTIDEVYQAGGGVVLLPAGTASLSEAVVLKSGVRLLGSGMRSTILRQDGGGAVIALQTDAPSTLNGLEVAHMTVMGKIADVAAGDGILCDETAFGVSGAQFHDLFVTQCGRSGFRFKQSTAPYQARNMAFTNVFIGSDTSFASGCQDYAFYAEGGFSNNTFRSCRIYNNKKGAYIGQGGTTISPEALHFDTVNVQNVDPADAVAHGIHLNQVLGAMLTNCSFDSVSPLDSTAASAALYVDGSASRHIIVQGGIFRGFHKGIHLYEGTQAEIEGVSFYWNGTVPADTPVDIAMGSNFGVYSVWLGRNHILSGSTAHTYASDPGNRSMGWFADGENIVGQTFKIFRSTYGPIIRSGSGSPEGAITAPKGSLYTRTDGGTGTTLYVKESGSSSTGWVAK